MTRSYCFRERFTLDIIKYKILPGVTLNSDKFDILQRIYRELDTWEYGCIIKNKRYDETILDEVNWDLYRTTPIDRLEKQKIGVCWDFVNYQHHLFKKNDIDDESYLIFASIPSENRVITHTFSIVIINGQRYWFEQSFYKFKGIYKIRDIMDVINTFLSHYTKQEKPYITCDIYRYSPDGLDKGLSDKEFIQTIQMKNPILHIERNREKKNMNLDRYMISTEGSIKMDDINWLNAMLTTLRKTKEIVETAESSELLTRMLVNTDTRLLQAIKNPKNTQLLSAIARYTKNGKFSSLKYVISENGKLTIVTKTLSAFLKDKSMK